MELIMVTLLKLLTRDQFKSSAMLVVALKLT